MVEAARKAPGLVARVWHPEAVGELLDLRHGVNAEVLVGNPAYQLSSGEIVAV